MGTTETQLRNEAAMQRARMGETLEAIGDHISPNRMVERRKEMISLRFRRAKDKVMGSPHYVEPVTQRMQSGMQSATGTMQSAAETVQHAPQALADQTRGNPLVAGAVAFGVGALLATVLPKSRTEERLLQDVQPQLQHAAQELKQMGSDVASDMKEHAQEAVQEVKSTGSDAAAQVKDQAQQSAQQLKEQAQR